MSIFSKIFVSKHNNVYSCQSGDVTLTVESDEHSLEEIRQIVLEDIKNINKDNKDDLDNDDEDEPLDTKFNVPDKPKKKIKVKPDSMFS